jgi:hypothetical protein
MLGRFVFAVAAVPAVAQPGASEKAPAEATVAPAIFRNSLLVCVFIIPPKTVSAQPISAKNNPSKVFLYLKTYYFSLT